MHHRNTRLRCKGLTNQSLWPISRMTRPRLGLVIWFDGGASSASNLHSFRLDGNLNSVADVRVPSTFNGPYVEPFLLDV